MIANVQILRILAALCVVIYHANFTFPGGLHTEFQGVALFFVISGFIICQIYKKYSSFGFLVSRILRLAPIYWFVTILSLSWGQLPPIMRLLVLILGVFLALTPGFLTVLFSRLDKRILTASLGAGCFCVVVIFARHKISGAKVWFILKGLLFIPALDVNGDMHPYLGVGWTLNMEFFFYIIFAFSMQINKTNAPIIAAAFLLIPKLLLESGWCANEYSKFYSHRYILYFIFGVLIHYLYSFFLGGLTKFPEWLVASAAFFAISFFFWINIFGEAVKEAGFLLYAMQFAAPPVLLAAALALEGIGLRCRNRHVLMLGAASYVLYLIHSLVIEAFRPFSEISAFDFQRLPGLAVMIGVCLLLSISIYRYVDAPLVHQLNRKFLRKI